MLLFRWLLAQAKVLDIYLLIFFAAAVIVVMAVAFSHRHKRAKNICSTLKVFQISNALSLTECEEKIKELAKSRLPVKTRNYNLEIRSLIKSADKKIKEVRARLESMPPNIISLVPAARWLFDNFYIIYREIKKDEKNISVHRKIPVIEKGEYKGYPRVFILVKEIVSNLGFHLSKKYINKMIKVYQETSPLTSAELLLIPDLIGLCLVEGILNASDDILEVVKIKKAADEYVQNVIDELKEDEDVAEKICSGANQSYRSNNTYIAHVLYALKKVAVDEVKLNKCVKTLSSGGTEPGMNTSDVFLKERRFETKFESSIRSKVESIKIINRINKVRFFERHSLIEKYLKKDPAGIYKKMDDESRNLYRWAVEKLSAKLKLPEWEVASKTMKIADKNQRSQRIFYPGHVGTYLIGPAKGTLNASLQNRKAKKPEKTGKAKNVLYFIMIGVFTLAFVAALVWVEMLRKGYIDLYYYIFLLIALFPVMGVAIELTNYLFNNFVPTIRFPAMDYSDGIPDDHKTIVVIPVILSGPEQLKKYIQRLEKYYLANPQSNLYFSLLADFKDAQKRELPEDAEILETAGEGFARLNGKYPSKEKRFSFFIRYRKWNEKESCWMGWERKRGKLEEFNALLFGEKNTSFIQLDGNDIAGLDLKYVITIDSDTDLIRGSAAKLVGIISHPLNRPVINPRTRKVERGYVIVQSQIRNHVGFSTRSIFSKVFSGQQGIDIYSNVVSDIYQDTFEAGTFLGKGIYDLKAMHQLLYHTLPENSVLSHDLLESCYTKCAFAGNVELMDTHPSNVISYSKREHRWIRGDWQLLPWLFGKDSLGGLSRWKIFDNMRRSIVPFCRLLVIILSAFLLPDAFYIWLPIVFFGELLRLIHLAVKTLLDRIRQPMSKVAVRNLVNAMYIIIEQAAFRFILLPYRTWIALDAVIRTLYRLYISKRQLLEWETAEAGERAAVNKLGSYLKMWKAAFPAGALLVLAAYLSNQAVFERVGMLLTAVIWFLSPVFSYLISIANIRSQKRSKNGEKYPFIRQAARRTWQYFKDFCTEENNFLCPDNYQVFPNEKESSKTSPTNIGLQLMSFLSARDLGYTGLISFVNRTEKTIKTIEKMDKWNGHLYNWYNTKTLETLYPEYVSTVDSGNFISYLITVKNGLLSFIDSPVFSEETVKGLAELSEIADLDKEIPGTFKTIHEFEKFIEKLLAETEREKRKPWEKQHWVGEFISQCREIAEDLELPDMKNIDFCEQKTLKENADLGSGKAKDLIERINSLARSLDTIINECDFACLFDKNQFLFHIGFNAASQNYDSSYYDLIASEAMLTSFLAIAKNEVPKQHWTKMGRPLIMSCGFPAFASWSGTMFEYLMPYLVLNEFPGSVYSITARAAVREQIAYGRKQDIPWGISESQYYRFDVASNYQYKAFGVPKLSQQPHLDKSLVVAPYASFLAMPFDFKKALKNILRLKEIGAYGEYGFYESIDYNSPDAESMNPFSVVKCYMTHHQGMSIVSVDNLLNDNIMRRRFSREPMIKSAEVILEEVRTSYVVPISKEGYAIAAKQLGRQKEKDEFRYVLRTSPAVPRTLWLSNNRYSLMLTSDGDGFSKLKKLMVNRWTSDTDSFSGQYIYIRETDSGRYWSAAYKPTMKEPDDYRVLFCANKAEFMRRDGSISTVMEVTLSPLKDIEIRKITITNHSTRLCKLETTSYLEVVMDEFYAGLYHPAFNKLFVESEIINEGSILVCRRRSGGQDAENPYLFHMLKTDAKRFNSDEYETDRQRFIGRNNTLKNPDAIAGELPLANSAEFSIDPIMSMRAKIVVPAGRSATVTYITGVCDSKEEAGQTALEYANDYSVNDVFDQFRLNSELEIKYLDLTEKQTNVIQDLIGPIFYPNRLYRADGKFLAANRRGQDGLWRFGISGDNPIILYKIKSMTELSVAKDVLKAYEYMRINEINVDLVILDEEEAGYFQDVRAMLSGMLASLRVYVENPEKPSLFIINSSQITEDENNLLMSAARVVFTENTGIYFRNAERETGWRRFRDGESPEALPAPAENTAEPGPEPASAKTNLEYYNGYGGFSDGGKVYEILLDGKQKTPMPWINVISNDEFGFIVSETGGGYTWAQNSSENKLTSWSNDPVTDPKSEILYIEDQKSGRISYPIRYGREAKGAYNVKHGFGYTEFSHKETGLGQELIMFVPEKEPVKLWSLELTNESQEEKTLYVTLHLKWELGRNRELTSQYIYTEFDEKTQCFTAKNSYGNVYRAYRAFMFSSEKIVSFTGDRKEYLEKKAVIDEGKAQASMFSNTAGAGYDPCGTIQVEAVIPPGEKKKVVFGLGYCSTKKQMESLCHLYSKADLCEKELKNIEEYWGRITEKITVTSHNRAMDFLINGWLVYQVYSCRMKARSAFYQAGGAFGFRDQLQDVLALLHADPDAAKRQILLACGKQFEEGDVLHWWHPPTGEGVRTRITDDYLWLPYVTAEYIKHTGDYSILDIKKPYLKAPPLEPDENEKIMIPQTTENGDSVYNHCLRALRNVEFGRYGLPLMGGGDWNDGMNRVGIEGEGQSVWLGWFVYAVSSKYLDIAKYKKDKTSVKMLADYMEKTSQSIEKSAWDGRWYIRAFYDDGTKLGSRESRECMIDSISQSWGIISQAADKDRARSAMSSAVQHLVKRKENLILLLTPPFDKTRKYPGYIKDYFPGIRENGGQYTHAGVWLAIAEMMLDDKEMALNLLTILNPICSTLTQRDSMKYAKEPYVVSGDVYYAENFKGYAGWSWYTGAAGWMYQALVSWLLGIGREGDTLSVKPLVPADFGEYTVKYRHGASVYIIDVPNAEKRDYKVKSMVIDGKEIKSDSFKLIDDGKRHYIRVNISVL